MYDDERFGYRDIEERYCPAVGHNVAFEVMRCGNTELAARCLELNNCDNDPLDCKRKSAE